MDDHLIKSGTSHAKVRVADGEETGQRRGEQNKRTFFVGSDDGRAAVDSLIDILNQVGLLQNAQKRACSARLSVDLNKGIFLCIDNMRV
jgi:hypothetical protein